MENNQRKTQQSKVTKFIQVNDDSRSSTIMKNIDHLKSVLMLDKHVDVRMPNSIFDDFTNCLMFETWQQEAFAYSYYFLSSYLFRNCIHSKTVDINDLNLTKIRTKLLGVAGKTMSDIYKENGILDSLGYTCTIKDLPVSPIIVSGKIEGFTMYSDVKAEDNSYVHISLPPRFVIKLPLKGLYSLPPKNYVDLLQQRKKDDKVEELLRYCDGHFFSFENTHKIQIETFIACLSNEKLGYKGFYLYAYYRMQSDRFKGGYNASIKQIQEIIPISERTLFQYHQELEKMNLIRKVVIPHLPNTYKAKSHVPRIEI